MPPIRRLTAILAADVAGYSRLMGAEEEGTHASDKPQASLDPSTTIVAVAWGKDSLLVKSHC
jgi:hypothetical protein